MNREDLKSYLGITTESLSRALTCLENKNCFCVKNREISEINFSKLVTLLDLDFNTKEQLNISSTLIGKYQK
jgi:CRP/FNR family transcriptional regulator